MDFSPHGGDFGIDSVATPKATLLYRFWGVGDEPVVFPLLQDEQFRTLDRASFRHKAQEAIDTVPARFLRLLFTAYAKGNVSAARIAHMTGQSLVEIRRQLEAIGEVEEAGQAELSVA